MEPGLPLKGVGSAGLGWFLSSRSDACVYGGRFAEDGQVRFVQRNTQPEPPDLSLLNLKKGVS
jgi:hypothetical protein